MGERHDPGVALVREFVSRAREALASRAPTRGSTHELKPGVSGTASPTVDDDVFALPVPSHDPYDAIGAWGDL
ncbi:hypothetical protein AKJ09_09846 [Labilithrix luteola]|uniref:Uncharacterized protein n=1 Tax=Labilithrix luteola TaxID=1391654 RepID=A0A0K1QBS1_9BACT|nr:hypothetical protein AKJ09_09846 [Labilithrix luteola]